MIRVRAVPLKEEGNDSDLESSPSPPPPGAGLTQPLSIPIPHEDDSDRGLSNPRRPPRSLLKRIISFFIQCANLLPVVLVSLLVGSAWYVFVVHLQSPFSKTKSGAEAFGSFLACLIFTVDVVLLFASYYRCVMTSSSVRMNPPPRDFPLETIQKRCDRCDGNPLKPVRAHHCSVCGECVLKMDHHCPWVGNCVALRNHKYFLLFLFYAALGCSIFAIFAANTIYGIFFLRHMESFLVLFVSILISAFGLTLIPFFGFHVFLVTKAFTTLEYGGTGERSPFDRGAKQNFLDMFGPTVWHWFLPIDSKTFSGWEFGQMLREANEPQLLDVRGNPRSPDSP